MLHRSTRFGALLAITAFAWLSLAGCDSQEDNTTPPDLFPAAAFTLQTDLFSQGLAPKDAAGINFTAAALRVWPVSILLAANLVIPSALTTSALQVDPTQEDGTWVWVASAAVGAATASYTLSGTRRDGGTDWSMRVTMTGAGVQEPLNDFELFSARTTDNGASGSWDLFYPIEGTSTNVLSADYAVASATEKSITFNIPATAEENAGDSVEYAENGDTRTFDWQQVGASLQHVVRWNALDQSGSIAATNFNNGAEACWDANLDDTACPAPSEIP